MCRMVGMIAATPDSMGMSAGVAGSKPATPAPLVASFHHLVGAPHALRVQARLGCVPEGEEPGHGDSWGIGWFDAAGQVSLLRQTGSAADSAYFVFGAETAARGGGGSGPAATLLGHLRKASLGAVTSENSHPVRADYRRDNADLPARPYESLLVAHNGTVRPPLLDELRAQVADAGREEARSDNDTVVLAGWLAHRLSSRPSGQDVLGGLRDALAFVLERADVLRETPDGRPVYSALNLLIAHPTGLYALRQFSASGDYYSLYRRPVAAGSPGDGVAGWVVASEPTDDGPGWEPLVPGEMLYFAAGGSGTPRRAVVR